MNLAREKARFKERLAETFDAFEARSDPSYRPDFIGAHHADPLEHTTRRYAIDDMLAALGWDLTRMTVDMVEEARLHGGTTLFLDYLGVRPDSRSPVLVVEAKSWEKPFVTPADPERATESAEALIAAAIEHCKTGGAPKDSPVVLEWAKWLHKLYQYLTTLNDQSGHKVRRVAITSGRWMVVFADPHEVFVPKRQVSTRHILVFLEREVIRGSDEIYENIARNILIGHVPEVIAPSHISGYVAASAVKEVFRAIWVARRAAGAHFDPFPQITLYPALVIERFDGQLLVIVDRGRERLSIPHKYDQLPTHIEDVARYSDELLAAVRAELGGVMAPAPLTSFPGFPALPRFSGNPSPLTRFLKSSAEAGDFLLVTGTERHYLLASPTVSPCAWHTWSDCHAIGEHQGNAAVVTRAHRPASFFTTTEGHHCAHRTVHGRRETRCHIAPFEEFLCCRACMFQVVCWTAAEAAALPCGVALPVAA